METLKKVHGLTGRKLSEETKERIRAKIKQRHVEGAFKNFHGKKGPKSVEHSKNISNSLTGRQLSKEHIEILKKIPKKKGWNHSLSTINKMKESAWRKGKTKHTDPYLREIGRKTSETKIKIFKELGLHKDHQYPEIWDEYLREEIRKRDSYTCQECRKLNVKIVHHIDWNKDNCDRANLITLCRPCHMRLHASLNKEYWINRFRIKILGGV